MTGPTNPIVETSPPVAQEPPRLPDLLAARPASERIDVVVVGAGAAGLSLVCHLAASGWAGSAVLLDDGAVPLEQRAWAYWSRGDLLLDPAASALFDRFRVQGPGFARLVRLVRYRYRTVTGADLDARAARLLACTPGIARVRGRATRILDGDDGARVLVDLGDGAPPAVLSATWVFDSVGLDGAAAAAGAGPHLEFLGHRVETEVDTFDADTPTLMDFRTDQSRGLAFVYVLPTSARAALVELTRFVVPPPGRAAGTGAGGTGAGAAGVDDRAASGADRTLPEDVRNLLSIGAHEVIGVERGRIPLVVRPAARRTAHVVPIGIPGGMVKASTGYAYERIQRHSAAIAGSLVRHGQPFDVPRPSRRHRVLDALLLDVVREEPELALRMFDRLFAANPSELVLRFLDEDTSRLEELALIGTLPPAPFLRALARRLRPRGATTRAATTVGAGPPSGASPGAAEPARPRRGRRRAP